MSEQGESGAPAAAGRRRQVLVAVAVVIALVVGGVLAWTRWQQAREEAAREACDLVLRVTMDGESGVPGDPEAGGGWFLQGREGRRTADGFAFDTETVALDDTGRRVESTRQVRTCTATEQNGRWQGRMVP